ncbi:MAG: OmpA family protein [Bacteroidota bacterium]|jgi:outer membrane protein OmpA-like peptidoglycan-associated protein
MRTIIFILTGIVFLSLQDGIAQQKDVTGCKDHPLFTRMPTYWIHNCDEKEFNAYAFKIGQGKTEQVEGRYWKLSYYPQGTAQSKPSELQILRNFENAVKELGGKVVASEKSRETLRLTKDGKDVWVEVTAEFTGKYGLTIIERKSMEQDIVVDAASFSKALRATGHIAVDGILFETGKADIMPESYPVIGEIAKLLASEPGLKLYVVGHTDHTGNLADNMTLSQNRAGAVMEMLTGTYDIEPSRLAYFGAGPYAPVATNDTEEGRAKNRRVELVKQ